MVGLRHWAIVIAPGGAAALRERVIAAADAPHEDTPEGLLVRDAWKIALRVVADVSLPQLVSRARDAA